MQSGADMISHHPSHNVTHLVSEDATGHEEEEIDELLQAEERELQAMIAMHEAEQDPVDVTTTTRPTLSHQQSSPFLGPDDADFEEFMSCPLLTDDAMDTS